MERQKLVMAEAFRKLAQPGTIARLPALLEIAGNDMVTDLSPIEMTQLMSALGKTSLSTQRVEGRLYWYNDLSYWMPDSNQAHASRHRGRSLSLRPPGPEASSLMVQAGAWPSSPSLQPAVSSSISWARPCFRGRSASAAHSISRILSSPSPSSSTRER